MKRYFIVMICAVLTLLSTSASAKTLVVYYSYTNNSREIVTTLTSQIEADVLEIQPAEKGLKYEANGYALGTQLLNAIKAAPNDASSYPAIDPVSTSLSDYETIIIVTPLWWSQMAAPMQTYIRRQNLRHQMVGYDNHAVALHHTHLLTTIFHHTFAVSNKRMRETVPQLEVEECL